MNLHSSGHSIPVHRFSSLLSFLFLAMHLYPDAYVFLLENDNEQVSMDDRAVLFYGMNWFNT
jgi:hypothetical protein